MSRLRVMESPDQVAKKTSPVERPPSGPPSPLWEYACFQSDPTALVAQQDFLNRMGSQGWELVAVPAASDRGSFSLSCVLIFKRRKP